MEKIILAIAILFGSFSSSLSFADDSGNNVVEHEVVRRLAFFPFETDEEYKKEAESGWASAREFLMDTKRFYVASKKLMIQKDVYQPRHTIINTDAILLGKLLDADCIVSTFVTKTEIKMFAYSGIDGFILWQNSVSLNPSLPVNKQLEPLSLKLTQDFLASMPYQGFQIIDPLIGKAVFEEGDISLAKVDVGAKFGIQIGDTVQWLRIRRLNSNPLFQGGGEYRVVAEGEVTKIEKETLLVQIKRAVDIKSLDKKNLVSFPTETANLQSRYALAKEKSVSPTLLSEPLYPTETSSTKSKPLVTSVVSIGSIAALLLLAL